MMVQISQCTCAIHLSPSSTEMMLLEATTYYFEKRGPWLPSCSFAPAEEGGGQGQEEKRKHKQRAEADTEASKRAAASTPSLRNADWM